MTWLLSFTAVALAVGSGAATAMAEPNPSSSQDRGASLEQPRVGYRAFRHLVVRARKLNKEGWLDVETVFLPGVGLRYTIVREGGDEGIRTRVLRKVLDQEVAASAPAAAARIALSPANYRLAAGEITRDGDRRWRLEPRRSDPGLLDGYAVLGDDGQLRRLEGRLSKSPSIWVRSVTICRRYERVAGYTLPVHLESVADVRFVGLAEFAMSMDYSEIDGRPVAMAHRTVDDFRASSQLLSLQADGAR